MHTDRLTGLVFVIFSAFLWFVVIPAQTEGAGEAFVPRLASLAIALPALIMLLNKPGQEQDGRFSLSLFLRITAPALLLFLLYLAALSVLGFFVPSAVFLLCALWLFGERRKSVFLLTPLLCLGGLYVVLVHFLHFELPRGILF